MGYRLRDGLGFCLVGGRVVFLDLECNRYFALDPGDDAAFQALVRKGERSTDQAFERFARCGLLEVCTDASALEPCARPRPAVSSVLDDIEVTTRIPARVAICWQLIATTVLLRTRPLDRIVADIRRAKLRLPARTGGSVSERSAAAHALERTRQFLTSHERCLLRSLALVRLLLRRGVSADLVFGVTTRPFRAHCWVEHDGMILNDRFENVRAYTPILVV